MNAKNQSAGKLTPRQKQILKLAKIGKHSRKIIAEKTGVHVATVCKEIREMREAGIDIPKSRVRNTSKALVPTVQKLPKGNTYERQIESQIREMEAERASANDQKAIVIIGGSEAVVNVLKNLRI